MKCDKNARSGYLRELQKIMPSEQMGMNELDLLGDLFAEDDAKETENKNTNDKPVETTKRKWSLLKQKNKGGNNNGNASTNGSNGNTPDVDGSKNDDDKTMDQILFETELDPNMKFFSTYDSKPQTGTDYSDLPAQTRSRNKHSLFDTQNDTLLKSYTNNDKKTDDNETNNTTNNTTNTTTTTTATNNNTNTIPTINENTNESKERKEKENENENGNETESKIEDTSNITRHRAQAAQAQDQDHPSTSLMSSTTTASENSENVEHVQNRSSRRIAVADMSAAMESMNSNSNTVTNTIITTSSSSNTNDDTATNTNTSSPDFPRISRPRIGYDASA